MGSEVRRRNKIEIQFEKSKRTSQSQNPKVETNIGVRNSELETQNSKTETRKSNIVNHNSDKLRESEVVHRIKKQTKVCEHAGKIEPR